MGFFDKFKNVLGSDSKPPVETVKGPSRVLKDAGIDPSCLKCKIGTDGSLTVSGTVESGAERDKIISVLKGMPNISSVINEINVGATPASTTPEPDIAAAPAPEPETPGGRTYSVKSGDTLWKISQEMYGNGSRYMKIFEANTPLLTNPDKIFPGQVLTIPELED